MFQYTIRPGECIHHIAKRFCVTTDEIFAANPGLTKCNLCPGVIIVIPETSYKENMANAKDPSDPSDPMIPFRFARFPFARGFEFPERREFFERREFPERREFEEREFPERREFERRERR